MQADQVELIRLVFNLHELAESIIKKIDCEVHINIASQGFPSIRSSLKIEPFFIHSGESVELCVTYLQLDQNLPHANKVINKLIQEHGYELKKA